MQLRAAKKPIAVALIVAAGITLALLLGERLLRARTPPAAARMPLPVVRAQKSNMLQTIELQAEFRPYQEVDVDAKVRGYVKSLRVDVGDVVKQGEVIAELEIPEASDDLAKAAAALDRARHQAVQAQAISGDAQQMYQRLAAVIKERPELVAQEDLDQAKDKADAAQAASIAAESAVSEAEAYHTQQRDLLDYSKITAPFDGVITRLYISDGALLGDSAGRGASSSGRSVVHLSQLNRLRLVIKVPESLVPTIHDGTMVAITVPALNIHKSLPVARISHQVDLETRTMHVEIDYPNVDLAVTPGLYADVDVPVSARSGVLAVPLLAIGDRKEDSGTVFVLGKNGSVQQRAVTLGLVGADEAEIKSGLAAGELVVVGAKPEHATGMVYEPRFMAAR
jgi:RND family efflux transporter MFP subunit